MECWKRAKDGDVTWTYRTTVKAANMSPLPEKKIGKRGKSMRKMRGEPSVLYHISSLLTR